MLATQRAGDIDERIVAAMASLLSDSAYNASKEMGLSAVDSVKIKYKEDYILMRNIEMGDGTQFILAVLTKIPESEDVEKYYDQLLDWAVDNSVAELEKLSSI